MDYTPLVLHTDLPEVHKLFNPGRYGEHRAPSPDRARAELAAVVESAGTSNIVVSEEDLTAFYWPWKRHARLLRDLLADTAERVHLILYCRRQDKVYESAYLQQVREGTVAGSIEDLMADRNTSPLHGNLSWHRKLDEYKRVVGADDARVGVYDLIVRNNDDIFHDFCRKLEIDDTGELEKSSVVNASLPVRLLPVFRHGRAFLPSRAFGLLERAVHLGFRMSRRSGGNRDLLSRDMRKTILEEYSADNRALCAAYTRYDESQVNDWLDPDRSW